MGNATQVIQIAALDTFLGSLDDSERRKVASVGTVDDLLHKVGRPLASYSTSRLASTLHRLQPVLQWFQSYNDLRQNLPGSGTQSAGSALGLSCASG